MTPPPISSSFCKYIIIDHFSKLISKRIIKLLSSKPIPYG